MLTDKFIRDRFTWLAYLLLGYFAFTESTFGPLMPFFSDELHLNYTQISLHFGAGAIGAMVMGLIGERVLGWLGRRVAMWLGAFGMAAGYLTLTLGRGPMITIGGLILAGVSGSLLLMAVQTGLVDRHGKRRAIALAEGNTGASLTAMLAPAPGRHLPASRHRLARSALFRGGGAGAQCAPVLESARSEPSLARKAQK